MQGCYVIDDVISINSWALLASPLWPFHDVVKIRIIAGLIIYVIVIVIVVVVVVVVIVIVIVVVVIVDVVVVIIIIVVVVVIIIIITMLVDVIVITTTSSVNGERSRYWCVLSWRLNWELIPSRTFTFLLNWLHRLCWLTWPAGSCLLHLLALFISQTYACHAYKHSACCWSYSIYVLKNI